MKSALFLLLLICSQVSLAQTSGKMQFFWRQYSGPVQIHIENPNTDTTMATGFTAVGIYGFEFTVSNEFGLSKDSCLVTVIKGALSIREDSVYRIQRPEIKALEIKSIVRGSDIYVQIKSPRQQTIKCIIYDVVGRPLAQIDIQAKKGISYATIPKPQVRGVYIIRFMTYYENVSEKIFI